MNSLVTSSFLRGERSVRSMSAVMAAPDTGRRTIYDCRGAETLPMAQLARTEDGRAPADGSVNRAFDGFGVTRDFYAQVLGRNSIDDHGMRLNGYVHFGHQFQNAFWDGQEMVFGDGDGQVFEDFTKSLDVIAHELSHGVTEYTANLEYHNQSGALNESISDVFGSLVKQWKLRQSADKADWLIGAEIFTPGIRADALRSMKAPGKAYDNALLGRDPQPDHMDRYVKLRDTKAEDWGGVHINSGIPNRAFYLTATGIGGNAWDAPGHIWYESLKASTEKTQFQDFANTTYAKAGQLYGSASQEQRAVVAAWREVGIQVQERLPSKPGGSTGGPGSPSGNGDSLAELTRQVQRIADELETVAADLAGLRATDRLTSTSYSG